MIQKPEVEHAYCIYLRLIYIYTDTIYNCTKTRLSHPRIGKLFTFSSFIEQRKQGYIKQVERSRKKS